jgi:hypothetical protein
MRFTLILLLAFTMVVPAIAQTDTTNIYLNEQSQRCSKDSAHYIGKVFRQGDLWGRKDYSIKNNRLHGEGTFLDSACTKAHGTFKYYRETGTLLSTTEWAEGTALTADYFYESGKKEGHVIYPSNDGRAIQQAWDEDGNVIPGYVVEREARFPGGREGWLKYLEENLNANVASRASKTATNYKVIVRFVVDKEGVISDVYTTEVPPECPKCGKQAIRIIKNAPDWEPAMLHNKPVLYKAIQHITFQVLEK